MLRRPTECANFLPRSEQIYTLTDQNMTLYSKRDLFRKNKPLVACLPGASQARKCVSTFDGYLERGHSYVRERPLLSPSAPAMPVSRPLATPGRTGRFEQRRLP